MNKIFKRLDGRVAQMVMFHDDDGNPLEDSIVEQSFAKECDINNIVERYRKTGQLPQGALNGTYGDFSDVGTFQDAMVKIQEANDIFDSLPAKIRARFEHDTGKFLDFVADPTNNKELMQMGLIDDPEEYKGVPVGTPVSEPTKVGEQSEQ